MSGIGVTELLLLFVIGLLILGPERLPRVATQIGRWVGRARRTANQLRYQLEREVALADIEESTRTKARKKPQAGDTASSPAAEDTAAEGAAAADNDGSQSHGSAPESSAASPDKPVETESDDDVKQA